MRSHLTVLLDRSASMRSIAADTIAGYNALIEDQKRVSGPATVTLIQFDDHYELFYEGKPITLVRPLTPDAFTPRGHTALFAAACQAIDDTDLWMAHLTHASCPECVFFAIVTDGQDNYSEHLMRPKGLGDLAWRVRERPWHFTFLGANQDAPAFARRWGLPSRAALTYHTGAAGVRAAFAGLSQNLADVRVGIKPAIAFTKAERAAAVGAIQ